MKVKLSILFVIVIALIALFLLYQTGGHWDYVLPRRGKKILAMVITGSAIAFSTVVFQTITNNRILTPSILGLDSLYMLFQTFIIYAFGSTTLTSSDRNINFVISVALMIGFSGVFYKILFRKEGQSNIYFLLLIGMILGTFFGSISSFMEVLIDPNEFLMLQDKMFASFNNVNTDLLIISIIGIFGVTLYFLKFIKYLDVISLGRDQAVNLGVNYDYVVKRLLVVVAILMSIATALVGPITFLGLLVVNVAHQFLKTYQHKYLIVGSILISIIALIGGQFIVEKVFTFSTTLSVIINFVGGAYFIYLLLKENKS
ncbi:iron chelate uptake ABC transporter family permease subunit [Paenibacillus macquariensis]|uniref:Iron complex transport system permease protein n=1 Tax=Paenibacillus macquariensis TaxID=948756 RepID=A0ABY1K9Y1_9BACL|nr:iron chelate uptake ABC transporter family permease subunit [Paenibacillus macquariensis]MEC0092367.1 iron chelate uptake ABC transporter family permease subunit [Paenibacillus macquariensis]OAB35342.1 iron ABC transporter permease [Paenibacillus macquariensis subsp. macquariensis]SIR48312.1 iron complex transport system permease protein [Paenibacillus macquariensis]